MYDFQRRDLISRAIQATMTARDSGAIERKCVICDKERPSYPSKIEVVFDSEHDVRANILETKEVPDEKKWIELSAPGALSDVKISVSVCGDCALEKGLVAPEASPAPAATDLEIPALKKEEEIPF